MKIPYLILTTLALYATGLHAEEKSAASYFKNPSSGGLDLKSIGKIAFGPGGMLLISDPMTTSIVAVDTVDTGPVRKLAKRVDDIEAVLAKAAGVAGVIIVDMAVNPASGSIYFCSMQT